jgi:hypothetical protein
MDECAPAVEQNRNRLDRIVEQLLIHGTRNQPQVYAAAGVERPAESVRPLPVATARYFRSWESAIVQTTGSERLSLMGELTEREAHAVARDRGR